MMKKIAILFMLFAVFFMGCDVNGLFEPEESNSDRAPRGRRPVQDPPPDDNVSSSGLYFPLQVGKSWHYSVVYKQDSKSAADYHVAYRGEEQWVCSLARWSDSTFVFQTHFTGEKTIIDGQSEKIFPIESAYAAVTAKIVNSALIIVREEGDQLCPFLGDWLNMMKTNFRIVFDDSRQIIEYDHSGSTTSGHVKLQQDVGLIEGDIISETNYDVIHLNFSLKQ